MESLSVDLRCDAPRGGAGDRWSRGGAAEEANVGEELRRLLEEERQRVF